MQTCGYFERNVADQRQASPDNRYLQTGYYNIKIIIYNIIYYCDVVFIVVALYLMSSFDIGSSESISKPNKINLCTKINDTHTYISIKVFGMHQNEFRDLIINVSFFFSD